MYWYRDTERDIPNTFAPDIIENEDFCIPEIISFLDDGFMKRDDIPPDVLKRIDAEIKFVRETQLDLLSPDPDIKNIPNTFLPLCELKIFSVNELIELLRWGMAKQEKLPEDVRKMVFDELHSRSRPYQESSRSEHSEIVNLETGENH